MLEAVGDDYSAFGHARISTFTGLPDGARLARPRAAVGRTTPARRRADVDRIYTTHGPRPRRAPLLDRYGVRYVVVGPIERADHGDAGVAKWDQLGRRVFDRDGTTVWRLR